jgi:hypothetical protein
MDSLARKSVLEKTMSIRLGHIDIFYKMNIISMVSLSNR